MSGSKRGPAPKWGESVKQFPSRIPQGLFDTIEAQAKALGCSTNEILVATLAQAFEYELPAAALPKASAQEALPLIEASHVAA